MGETLGILGNVLKSPLGGWSVITLIGAYLEHEAQQDDYYPSPDLFTETVPGWTPTNAELVANLKKKALVDAYLAEDFPELPGDRETLLLLRDALLDMVKEAEENALGWKMYGGEVVRERLSDVDDPRIRNILREEINIRLRLAQINQEIRDTIGVTSVRYVDVAQYEAIHAASALLTGEALMQTVLDSRTEWEWYALRRQSDKAFIQPTTQSDFDLTMIILRAQADLKKHFAYHRKEFSKTIEDKTFQSTMQVGNWLEQMEDHTAGFALKREQLEQAHQARVVRLTLAGNDEALAEEYAAQAERLAKLNESEAERAAKDRQGLGKQVLAYFEAWALARGVSEERAGEMRAAIAEHYGLVNEGGARLIDSLGWTWERWASGQAGTAEMVVANLGRTYQATRDVQDAVAALPTQVTVRIALQYETERVVIYEGATGGRSGGENDTNAPTFAYADGAFHTPGGAAWVGEAGPEMVLGPLVGHPSGGLGEAGMPASPRRYSRLVLPGVRRLRDLANASRRL